MTRISSTASQWPQAAAAAGIWWDESTPSARPSRKAPVQRVEEPEWAGVATAALAWWEDGAGRRKARRSPVVKLRSRDAEPAQWPEIAAAATVWWDETFSSGVFAKARASKTLVA